MVITVGFSLTVLFAMSSWTRLLPSLPFWFILLPAWLSHVALIYCHLRSANALSHFTTQANENRQRPELAMTVIRKMLVRHLGSW
jgi:hypothetical protein